MIIAFKSNTDQSYNPEDFLKKIYKDFESFGQIKFLILSMERSEENLLIESHIHRYCRAVGFAKFKIVFTTKNETKVDMTFPN